MNIVLRKNLSYIGGAIIISFGFLILGIISEYGCGKVLLHKNLIPPDEHLNARWYGRSISFWTASQNTPGFEFQGIDDQLHPGDVVACDRYGFITGDTAPIAKIPAPHTIRIFLMGGSAAFGSLQTRSVIRDSSYPEGAYTYQASIAGRLKKLLEQAHPETIFEVINAAVIMHQFNQNYALYFERIHDFHPDIIITMEGTNDGWIYNDYAEGGDPYTHAASQGHVCLDLELLQRSRPFGKTWMLLNYLALHCHDRPKSDQVLDQFEKRFGKHRLDTLLAQKKIPIPTGIIYPPDSFQLLQPIMRRHLQKQLWLIASYEHQLAIDRVHSIFCLQPMLSRLGMQKQLSTLEQKLRAAVNEDAPIERMYSDSLLLAIADYPDEFRTVYRQMGDAKFFINDYVWRSFINDYVSPTIDSIVESSGGTYIDMNAEITGLSASQEFFMDYCHLTPYGSQFVAAVFARRIDSLIASDPQLMKK